MRTRLESMKHRVVIERTMGEGHRLDAALQNEVAEF